MRMVASRNAAPCRALFAVTVLLGAIAANAQQPQLAPVQPQFWQRPPVGGPTRLGYACPPVAPKTGVWSDVPVRPAPAAYEAVYDLRRLGKLPPVRNQFNSGSCWAFAALGSLESALLPGDACDFSENNLKNRSGFDYGPNEGGNAAMAVAYLARWDGPVAEADDPFDPSSVSSPAGLSVRWRLQGALFLPSRSDAYDNGGLKRMVSTYGAVFANVRWDAACYNATTHAFYNPSTSYANHAICIVGWDDAYPAKNFVSAPPGDGAFIVRNSRGASWGDGGYFYVSYHDAKIGRDEQVVFHNAQATSTYSGIYQYDPLGPTSYMGYGCNTGWAANVFACAGNESLRAVAFYAGGPGATYTVRVYRSPSSGPLNPSGPVATVTGSFDFAGLHTVALPTPIELAPGERFSVVVGLTTPKTAYPIAIEYPSMYYASKASALPGQSFVSADGTSFSDLTSTYPGTNVCIKAYTSAAGQGHAVVWHNDATLANALWTMAGTNVESEQALPAVPDPGWQPVGAADVDADGSIDVLWRHAATGRNLVWRMNGAALAEMAFLPSVVGNDWKVAAFADMDGDGKPDILWRHPASGRNLVWAMNGAQVVARQYLSPLADPSWSVAGVGDLDADGTADILWRDQAGNDMLWLMDGPTPRVKVPLPAVTDLSWTVAGLADFDGDGKADVLWRHAPTGRNLVWYMDGGTKRAQGFIAPKLGSAWRVLSTP